MGESKRGGLGSPSLIIFWLRSKSRRNNTKKRTTDRKVVRKLGTKKSVCAFHVPYSFMCLSCALGCISCAFHVPFMCLRVHFCQCIFLHVRHCATAYCAQSTTIHYRTGTVMTPILQLVLFKRRCVSDHSHRLTTSPIIA